MDIALFWQTLLAMRRLTGHRSWTRQQLHDFQLHQLASLRRAAYRKSSFYREFHADLSKRPLNELPVLTKRLVMDRFDELVTDRSIRLADLRQMRRNGPESPFRVAATSGST
jgi:phenylacetate-coenzyme A ligase PaaK-like adenylate-forming protein